MEALADSRIADDLAETDVIQREREVLTGLVALHRDFDLNQPDHFLKTARRLCPILLPSLSARLNAIKSSQIDSLFIEDLPVFDNEREARAMSLLLACMMGNPFQYLQQNQGEIVARVTPEMGQENTHSSSGRMRFGWHSDDSFLDDQYRTDLILLAGYYNPCNVRTSVSSLEAIRDAMDRDLFAELLKPIYNIRLPSSFRSQSGAELKSVPLIWFDGSRKANIAFSEYNASTSTAKGTKAIAALLEATERCATTYNLQPGTVLVFKNNRVLHARGQISGERTVFRVYVKGDLKELRRHPSSSDHVFDLRKVLGEMNFQF